MEAREHEELLLIDGGMCHYHIRKDGQLTIREIISTKRGSGKKMLSELKKNGASIILAKCPVNLESNEWYKKNGFELFGIEKTRSGKDINVWVLKLE
jgi:hypothetical protein